MIQLSSIPLDEGLRFKAGSADLLAKWNETLSKDPDGGGVGDKRRGQARRSVGILEEADGWCKGPLQSVRRMVLNHLLASWENARQSSLDSLDVSFMGLERTEWLQRAKSCGHTA